MNRSQLLVATMVFLLACSAHAQPQAERRFNIKVYEDGTFPTNSEDPNFENPFNGDSMTNRFI